MTATFSYTAAYVRELTPLCSGSVTAMTLVSDNRDDGGREVEYKRML